MNPPKLPFFLNDYNLSYAIEKDKLNLFDIKIKEFCFNYKIDIFCNEFEYEIVSFCEDLYNNFDIYLYSEYKNNLITNYKIIIVNLTEKKFKNLNSNFFYILEKFLFEANVINKIYSKKKVDIASFFYEFQNNEDIKLIHYNNLKKNINFYLNSELLGVKLINLINIKNYFLKNENLEKLNFSKIINNVHKIKDSIVLLNFKDFYFNNFLRLMTIIYKKICFYFKVLDKEIYDFLDFCLNLNIETYNSESCNLIEAKRNSLRIIKFFKDQKNLHFVFNYNKFENILKNLVEENICNNFVEMCKICLN